jgi:hypothetical protein
VLCAWQRLISWAQAGQAATITTLARRRDAQARELNRPALAEHVSDEIAAALRLTTRSASRLLDAADGLQRLPGMLAALSRGEIDWAKAGLFTDLLTGLPDEDAREIAAGLLGPAASMTTGQLRAALTRAVLACDLAAVRRRQDDARAEAGVHAWTETSGNTALAGRELATADVIHARVRLTARTCTAPGCRRAAAHCDIDHTIPYDQGGRTPRTTLQTPPQGQAGTRLAPRAKRARPDGLAAAERPRLRNHRRPLLNSARSHQHQPDRPRRPHRPGWHAQASVGWSAIPRPSLPAQSRSRAVVSLVRSAFTRLVRRRFICA